MNTATVKKAKEILNELIKNNIIALERDAPGEEDEQKTTGHNHLPIYQEETQSLEYLAYGGEETDSENKEECNYDLGILFEKEEEILRLKADIKKFRQSLIESPKMYKTREVLMPTDVYIEWNQDHRNDFNPKPSRHTLQ